MTGASSGIGAATARMLAAEGAAAAVVARRGNRLSVLTNELRADGATALVVEADITDPGQAQAAVEKTVAELGRLDTVVNNAGVMFTGPLPMLRLRSGSGCSPSTSRECSMSHGPPSRT